MDTVVRDLYQALRKKHLARGIECHDCPQRAAVYVETTDGGVRYLCPVCALSA